MSNTKETSDLDDARDSTDSADTTDGVATDIDDDHTAACPECGFSRINARTTKTPTYACYECGARFDDPLIRAKKRKTGRTNDDHGLRILCGRCGASIYTRAADSTACRNCDNNSGQNVDVVDGWLRRIAHGDGALSKLPSGPISAEDIDTDCLEFQERQMIQFIGGATHSSGQKTHTRVAYLRGDERRAAELFISENPEYCHNWFEGHGEGTSPGNFDPEMRELLHEQWILGGHEEVTPR